MGGTVTTYPDRRSLFYDGFRYLQIEVVITSSEFHWQPERGSASTKSLSKEDLVNAYEPPITDLTPSRCSPATCRRAC